ncbi:hypothetical protein Q5M85_13850 [Paraclostridium bifermentans]|nr:hypothetical protein [Paraclostridium bifermentans]
MSLKKRVTSIIICCTVILGSFSLVFADSSRVVTLGANLSSEQKANYAKILRCKSK